MSDAVVLRTHDVGKEFSGVRVLDRISIEVRRGEVLGIIGENGAGKSTLLKILCGIYHPEVGRIEIDGATTPIRDPRSARELGISMVPQEFNLIETLTVFENVFLGREVRRGPFLDKATMRAEARRLFAELRTEIDVDAMVAALSAAHKQMVEIAKALVTESKVLIMDEPTSVLTGAEVKVLFAIVRRLTEKGVAVVFISHRLWEVREICDRVLVLRDGAYVSLDPVDELDEREMAKRMVGRELTRVFPEKAVAGDEIALEVEHLSVSGLLEDVSLFVRKGEVLGIAGLVGAGRTELAEAIMGLRRKSGGTIRLLGRTYTDYTTREIVDAGLGYLSEDRQGRGLILGFGIDKNVTLISLDAYARLFIDTRKEGRSAARYVDQFSVQAAAMRSELRYLSGGNQQKVYLAKWMDTEPSVLILDEPTRGIDVHAKREFYHFINGLAGEGIACIVISSELEEVIGLAGRVYVMRGGRIAGELVGEHITEEEIMYYATGLKEGDTGHGES